LKKIWSKPTACLPLLFAGLGLSSPTLATPPSRASSLLSLLVPVTTVRQSGGDEVAFAKNVGQALSRYSARTQYEACANICRSPSGTWVAEVVSIGSHSSCLVSNRCPAGTQDTGRLIHSHPSSRSFVANEVDFRAWGKPFTPNTRVQADDPSLFSEADFATPGYLVVNGQLYYQQGPRHIRSLGPIASP